MGTKFLFVRSKKWCEWYRDETEMKTKLVTNKSENVCRRTNVKKAGQAKQNKIKSLATKWFFFWIYGYAHKHTHTHIRTRWVRSNENFLLFFFLISSRFALTESLDEAFVIALHDFDFFRFFTLSEHTISRFFLSYNNKLVVCCVLCVILLLLLLSSSWSLYILISRDLRKKTVN